MPCGIRAARKIKPFLSADWGPNINLKFLFVLTRKSKSKADGEDRT
jgi:hypothetical protein